jgi:hypothetical protein
MSLNPALFERLDTSFVCSVIFSFDRFILFAICKIIMELSIYKEMICEAVVNS